MLLGATPVSDLDHDGQPTVTTIGALITTHTILAAPYHNYSTKEPKTQIQLLRPLYYSDLVDMLIRTTSLGKFSPFRSYNCGVVAAQIQKSTSKRACAVLDQSNSLLVHAKKVRGC